MASTDRSADFVKLEKELTLRDDFPLPTLEQWWEVAQESLKGAPFEKKLITPTAEGVSLQPIYTPADLAGTPEQVPGTGHYRRGTQASGYAGHPWQVAQELGGPDDPARLDLERGADALVCPLNAALRHGRFTPDAPMGCGRWLTTLDDVRQVLAGVEPGQVPLHLDGGTCGLELLALLTAWDREERGLRGTVVADPLAVLAETGSLSGGSDAALDRLAAVLRWQERHYPQLRTIGVNGYLLRQAGGDAVLELAAMLSMGVWAIDGLTDRGLALESITRRIAFLSGIGPSFFMEIAKFRALRVLWSRLVEAYGGQAEAGKAWVRAKTSTYGWTRYDRHVNMLRATTEAFSAVVGGVDALTVTPFDRLTGEEDEFSRRIARNVQILLREESHLDRVADPAGGSYYVEWLTDQLIERAWQLFLEIDRQGGYLEALRAGSIQERIAVSHQNREKDLRKRKQVLVGINNYANVKEEPPRRPAPDARAAAAHVQAQRNNQQRHGERATTVRAKALEALARGSDEAISLLTEEYRAGTSLLTLNLVPTAGADLKVEPLPIRRLADPFETLRDRVADRLAAGRPAPRALLLTMGPMGEYKARAEFCKGFLEVAGFEVIYPSGFADAEAALAAAAESAADVVVICSQDERYPEWVPALAPALKRLVRPPQVALAGFPKEQVEGYRAQGIEHFLFLGCDAPELLTTMLNQTEVNS